MTLKTIPANPYCEVARFQLSVINIFGQGQIAFSFLFLIFGFGTALAAAEYFRPIERWRSTSDDEFLRSACALFGTPICH